MRRLHDLKQRWDLLTRTTMGQPKKPQLKKPRSATLKSVAEHVGLTPGTVSAVLNDSPSARSIPERTKNRIMAAANELNYRPNFFARSLRKKRTYTIGVLAEEIGDVYGSMVISGIEAKLREQNYFFITVVHRHDPTLLQSYSEMLLHRGVEGFIMVDTSLSAPPVLPSVAVAGHRKLKNVTNVLLDHDRAAEIALEHLVKLGHKKVAFLKGHALSSDSEVRWQSIIKAARKLDLEIDSDLVIRIEITDPSPYMGYPYGKQLLARGKPFTALFAYNDLSAIGAIRAFQEEGRTVPGDISVIGFDDIQSAAYNTPSLTTVRQPLAKMGQIAAETLTRRLEGWKEYPSEIAVEPELVARESTARLKRT
jgi:LacI family transcriptional regulator, galactose operon repressor